MRALTNGRGLHPRVYSDTVRFWPFDETTGNVAYDVVGGQTLTRQGSVDRFHARCPAGYSRRFTGSGDSESMESGASSDETVFQGDWTVEILFSWDEDGSGSTDDVLFSFGGDPTSSTSANNLQLSVRIDGDRTILVGWEHGSGTFVSDNTTMKVEWEMWNLLQLVGTTSGGQTTVAVYYNGNFVENLSAMTSPSGGSSGVYSVANSVQPFFAGTSINYFYGEIGSILVHGAARTADELRESARRVFGLYGHFQDRVRVDVEDGDATMQDLTDFNGYDWIEKARLSDGIDSDVISGQVSLTASIGNMSMSWADENSKVNQNAAQAYDALLMPGRDIDLYNAHIPLWLEPTSGDWDIVCEGIIERVNPGGNGTVDVDFEEKLLTTLKKDWTTTETQWGAADPGTDMTTVMESIIDGYTTLSPFPNIDVYADPGFKLITWDQGKASILRILQSIAANIAGRLDVRYNHQDGAFRIYLVDPDRSRVDVSASISHEDIARFKGIPIDRRGVRNYIQVKYEDKDDLDQDGVPKTKYTVRQDATSQGLYGEQRMFVSTAFLRRLDTLAEAQTWGDRALADLKDPEAEIQLELDGFLRLWPSDNMSIGQLRKHFSTEQTKAVARIGWQWEHDRVTTSMTLRGKPSGGYHRWLETAAQGPDDAPNDSAPPTVITDIGVVAIDGGIEVKRKNRPRHRNPRERQIEVHALDTIGEKASYTFSTSNITRSTGSFVTAGWRVGDEVSVSGSASNDANMGTITNVAALTLTVAGFVAEGPVTCTLERTDFVPDLSAGGETNLGRMSTSGDAQAFTGLDPAKKYEVRAYAIGEENLRGSVLDLGQVQPLHNPQGTGRPSVSVGLSSNQNASGTATPVQLANESWDDNNDWDTTNHEFVAPYDGVFEFLVLLSVQPPGGTAHGYALIRKDTGGGYATQAFGSVVDDALNASTQVSVVFAQLKLDAGDKVEVAYFASAGTHTILSASTVCYVNLVKDLR